MKRDIKAMIKLGLYLAMSDFDAAVEELETHAGLSILLAEENPTIINRKDLTTKAFLEISEETFLEWMTILNLGEGEKITQGLLNAISQEAQYITDETLRQLTLKFCLIIADADKDFKSIELSTIKFIHQYWVDRNDGWDKDLNVHLKSIGITILAE